MKAADGIMELWGSGMAVREIAGKAVSRTENSGPKGKSSIILTFREYTITEKTVPDPNR